MASIKITGGSLPKQDAVYVFGTINIKNNDGRYVKYIPRAAITEIDKVSEHKKQITFKAMLCDGNNIVAKAKRKTYDKLVAEHATQAPDYEKDGVLNEAVARKRLDVEKDKLRKVRGRPKAKAAKKSNHPPSFAEKRRRDQKKEKAAVLVSVGVCWFVAYSLIIQGIVLLSLPIIALSFLCVPRVQKFIFPQKIAERKATIMWSVIILAFVLSHQISLRVEATRASDSYQLRLANFQAKKPELLNNIRALIAEKEYLEADEAIALQAEFEDQEFISLGQSINSEVEKEKDRYASLLADEEERRAEIAEKERRATYFSNLNHRVDSVAAIKVRTGKDTAQELLDKKNTLMSAAPLFKAGKEDELNGADKAEYLKIKKRLARIQRQVFPKLRDAYGPALRRTFWENDISVKTYGKGYKIIEFTGVTFAANRNIAAFHSKIKYVLQSMRFDQVRYKWSKGASQYDYYDISVLEDDVIMPF